MKAHLNSCFRISRVFQIAQEKTRMKSPFGHGQTNFFRRYTISSIKSCLVTGNSFNSRPVILFFLQIPRNSSDWIGPLIYSRSYETCCLWNFLVIPIFTITGFSKVSKTEDGLFSFIMTKSDIYSSGTVFHLLACGWSIHCFRSPYRNILDKWDQNFGSE